MVKKKRGRPKGSKNKTSKTVKTVKTVKKRGRPKGSKNKKTLEKEAPKKRGRPKGSKNKKTLEKEVPKKRGRPKGSKNKKTLEREAREALEPKVVKVPKKRGRPKGSRNKTVKAIKADDIDLSNVKIGKLLGYCPKCKGMLSNKDLESPRIFICPTCSKRARTNKIINKPKKKGKEYQNKQEYLQDVLGADHHDMPGMKHELENVKVDL